MKGTIGANKLKKRVGIFNIFSSNKVSHYSGSVQTNLQRLFLMTFFSFSLI